MSSSYQLGVLARRHLCRLPNISAQVSLFQRREHTAAKFNLAVELDNDENVLLPVNFVAKSSWREPLHDDSFLRKKYSHLFKVYDVNKDKLFTSEDVRLYQQRMIDVAQLKNDGVSRFLDVSSKYFEGLLGERRGGISPRMTLDIFVENLVQKRKYKTEELQESLVRSAGFLWKCLDLDGDGAVERDSFEHFLNSQLIEDPHIVDLIFNAIDQDGNGKVEVDELVESHLDFMMNEKPDLVSVLQLGGRKE